MKTLPLDSTHASQAPDVAYRIAAVTAAIILLFTWFSV